MLFCEVDHFFEQGLHFTVPFEKRFIIDGSLEIAQHMCQTFLMMDSIGIECPVMVMDCRAAELFQRSSGDPGMSFGVPDLIECAVFVCADKDCFVFAVDVG